MKSGIYCIKNKKILKCILDNLRIWMRDEEARLSFKT